MSYANVILYSAALPSYQEKTKRKDHTAKAQALDANDPKNYGKLLAIFNATD